MGKKYLLEIEENKDGSFAWSNFAPYTAPDLEQVRKEAYEKGLSDVWKCVDEINSKQEQVKKEAYEQGRKDVETQFCSYDACKNRQEEYQRGLADAWDAARKICTNWVLPDSVLSKIFGIDKTIDDIMKENTASEAIEKIRQYEQEKEEQIQVGDEVIPRETEYDDMIVTRLWKDDYDSDCIDAIGFDGRISSFLVSRVSKTGKHYEIAAVLEKMRGEQDG